MRISCPQFCLHELVELLLHPVTSALWIWMNRGVAMIHEFPLISRYGTVFPDGIGHLVAVFCWWIIWPHCGFNLPLLILSRGFSMNDHYHQLVPYMPAPMSCTTNYSRTSFSPIPHPPLCPLLTAAPVAIIQSCCTGAGVSSISSITYLYIITIICKCVPCVLFIDSDALYDSRLGAWVALATNMMLMNQWDLLKTSYERDLLEKLTFFQ